MSENLTLKKIGLTKLNNLLNPNYINKFILLTFSLGSTLIAKTFILELLLSLELMTPDFYLRLQLSDLSSKTIFIIGCVLIFLSVWMFYKTHVSSNVIQAKHFKNLKSASNEIIKLMEENERIFKECGPNSSVFNQGELRMEFSVWENAKRNIIVPNNKKIYDIITRVKKASDTEKRFINKMKSHIEHFEVHIDDPSVDYSKHQFPIDFLDLIYSYKKVSNKQSKKIEKVASWLEAKLAGKNIESVYIFGSYLYSESSNDVDILIRTKDCSYKEIKCKASSWKIIESDFKKEFCETLHLSVFTELEKEAFQSFKKQIRTIKKVL